MVLDWLNSLETDEEIKEADKAIAFVKRMNGAKLALVQVPQSNRDNIETRQKNALSCLNAVAKRTVEQGVACSFHPNSPLGSVFRTAEDYEIMINGLDPALIGYTPDSGHIENGGRDALEIIKNIEIVLITYILKILIKMARGRQWAMASLIFPQ